MGSHNTTNIQHRTTSVLDSEFPLQKGSHKEVDSYTMYYSNLLVYLKDGSTTGLAKASNLREVCGRKAHPESIVLDNGDTSAELELDAHGSIRRLEARFA